MITTNFCIDEELNDKLVAMRAWPELMPLSYSAIVRILLRLGIEQYEKARDAA